MKQAILISLLVGGAAGAGSALLTGTFTSEGSASTPAKSSAVDRDRGGDLLEQVALLSEENQMLVERVRALENRELPATAARRAPASVDAVVPEGLEQRLAALEAVFTSSQGRRPASLAAAVEDAVLAIEEQELREAVQLKEQRRIERADERIVKLTEELGLNTGQAASMRGILIDESTKRDELIAVVRETGDWRGGNMREKMGAIRDDANERASLVLTPEQFEEYKDTNTGWGRGGSGRGGRGSDSTSAASPTGDARGGRRGRGGD